MKHLKLYRKFLESSTEKDVQEKDKEQKDSETKSKVQMSEPVKHEVPMTEPVEPTPTQKSV